MRLLQAVFAVCSAELLKRLSKTWLVMLAQMLSTSLAGVSGRMFVRRPSELPVSGAVCSQRSRFVREVVGIAVSSGVRWPAG